MALDTLVFHLLNDMAGQSPALDGAFVFFASYLGYALIGLFLALAFISRRSLREKLSFFFIAALSSVTARFGVAEFIRFFYHRPRPFADLSVTQLLATNEWSFPSGHATFYFALATAVYLYDKKWGIGFFAAAALMGASRVVAGIHYPSDIALGALIGVLVAYIIHSVARNWVAKI